MKCLNRFEVDEIHFIYIVVLHEYVCCTDGEQPREKRKRKKASEVAEPKAEWPDTLSVVLLREATRNEMEKHEGKEAKYEEEDNQVVITCKQQNEHDNKHDDYALTT